MKAKLIAKGIELVECPLGDIMFEHYVSQGGDTHYCVKYLNGTKIGGLYINTKTREGAYFGRTGGYGKVATGYEQVDKEAAKRKLMRK